MREVIDTLFLRIYAMNLRRGWRNVPTTAWTDASVTMDLLFGLPAMLLAGTLWSVLMDLFPQTVGRFGMPDWALLGLVVGSWLAVDTLLSRKVRRYKDDPSLLARSASMVSPSGTKISLFATLMSFASCVTLVLVTIFLHKLLSSTGSPHATIRLGM